jgi:hypothetical protein
MYVYLYGMEVWSQMYFLLVIRLFVVYLMTLLVTQTIHVSPNDWRIMNNALKRI